MQRAALLPALGEGFKVIGRAPLAVVAWGVFALVVAVIPYLPIAGALVPAFRNIGQNPEGIMTAVSAVGPLVQLLQLVLSVVSGALLTSAIYRAVLRPEERGFFYFKFSADELRVGVTFVVLYIMMVIYMVVAMLIIAFTLVLPFGLAAAMDSGDMSGAVLWVIPVILAVSLALALPALRLSMALPMTFAQGRICIFEAWAFTRGYTWSLFGLMLVQILIVMAITIALVLAAVAIIGVVAVTEGPTLAGDPASLFALAPMVGFIVLAYLLVSFLLTPILYAPWAKAYQLIAEAQEDGKAEVFS